MTHTMNYRILYNTVVLVTLLHIGHQLCGIDGSVQFHHQSEENEYRLNESFENIIKLMDAPKDHKLSLRLPSNTLLKYTSYKDVSILHFRVPSETRAAYFTFKAVEDSKSPFQRNCKAKDVTLHLKANSLPVISPENITFPKNFVSPEERFKVYNLQFKSDSQQQRIDIQGPHIGSWFAVAFVSWTDPNNDRIEQQGLSVSCDTVLLAELFVSSFSPTIINDGQVTAGNLTSSLNSIKITKLQDTATGEQALEEDNGHEVDVSESTRARHFKDQDERLRHEQMEQLIIAIHNFTHTQAGSGSRQEIEKPNNSDKEAKNNEITYKFFVPEGVGEATAIITFEEVCSQCPDISFQTQANAYPSINSVGLSFGGNEHNYLHRTIVRPNQTDYISIEFYVQPNTWHYGLLKFEEDDGAFEDAATQNETDAANLQVAYTLRILYKEASNLSDSESIWQPERFRGMDFYPLLRQSYHEFFMFDFDLQPDANGTVPALLNLTAQTAVGFAFELGEVNDIGGTLTFAVSMKHDLRSSSELKAAPPTISPPSERSGILAERLVSGVNDSVSMIGTDKLYRSRQKMQIIVCMHQGVPGVPTWPDKCRYGHRLMHASSIVNLTDNMGLVHVPFPESGLWYVTMRLYCHEAETARALIIDSVKKFVRTHSSLLQEMRSPCVCAVNAQILEACIETKDCLHSMSEMETLKVKECLMDAKCTDKYLAMTHLFEKHHKMATEQQFALDNCSTSAVFSISSTPCVAGRCGRFGRCYHYMSGGFVFSTCVCMKGYRGWDCSEDSQVPSNMSILLATLLLTLSNLLFIPSIYLALRRRYYTEGVIYFFAMFYSVFYHACDSGEDEYSFCLVKIGVLQFCDFYCGLLAIWVTLIAMAHVPHQFASLLHMFGAILLAFGTELNKQSLWVFLAPALTGISLISVSWGLRCVQTRQWFPARRYLTIFLPLGMVMVMIGLVCYAFLQTKQNYHIVHSIWHMVMALSIMLLLPARKSFIPKC